MSRRRKVEGHREAWGRGRGWVVLSRALPSLLLSAGAPLLHVSQELGHRRPTTPLRYYAKWTARGDQRLVELLAGSAAGGSPSRSA
jgi:hypothetical protein